VRRDLAIVTIATAGCLFLAAPRLQAMMRQVSEQAGRQAEILSETCESNGPVRIYTRIVAPK